MIYIKNETEIPVNIEHERVCKWISKVIIKEGFNVGEIEIRFVSEKEITHLNKQYLNHNYPTDVISFEDNKKSFIYGTIFIGIQTVKENAILHNVNLEDEVLRVIIHGVLHLIGYMDKTDGQKEVMKAKEDEYLNII